MGSFAVLAEIGTGANGLGSPVLADHHLFVTWVLFTVNTAGIAIIVLVIIRKVCCNY